MRYCLYHHKKLGCQNRRDNYLEFGQHGRILRTKTRFSLKTWFASPQKMNTFRHILSSSSPWPNCKQCYPQRQELCEGSKELQGNGGLRKYEWITTDKRIRGSSRGGRVGSEELRWPKFFLFFICQYGEGWPMPRFVQAKKVNFAVDMLANICFSMGTLHNMSNIGCTNVNERWALFQNISLFPHELSCWWKIENSFCKIANSWVAPSLLIFHPHLPICCSLIFPNILKLDQSRILTRKQR